MMSIDSKKSWTKRIFCAYFSSKNVLIDDNLLQYCARSSFRIPKYLTQLKEETLNLFKDSHKMISENQGRFLYLLSIISGAKRILEIGTFSGMNCDTF